jgi:hypothetical protein
METSQIDCSKTEWARGNDLHLCMEDARIISCLGISYSKVYAIFSVYSGKHM